MRNSVSMRCMIASDAACIIGGFIAGVLVIQLVQSASQPSLGLLASLQARRPDATVTVDRAVKSDRSVFLSFDERFGQQYWVGRGDGTVSTGDDPFGRLQFWLDPTENTTSFPNSREPTKPGSTPNSESNGGPKPQHSPLKTIGCDPLASPLVEPELARFAGRCLAELPSRQSEKT